MGGEVLVLLAFSAAALSGTGAAHPQTAGRRAPAAHPAVVAKRASDVQARFRASDAELRKGLARLWPSRAGLYRGNKSRAPAHLHNAVIITIANWGYRDLYHNWECFARRHDLEYLVLSMDPEMHRHVGSDRSVLLPGAQSVEVALASEEFNLMGCAKLAGVLALMEDGADVVVVDTDCVFARDPQPLWEEAARYDFLFQANHHGCRSKDQFPPGMCLLLNSGLYYVRGGKRAVQEMWWAALVSCRTHARLQHVSATEGGSDQKALQRALHAVLSLPLHWTRHAWGPGREPDPTYVPPSWRASLGGLPGPFSAACWCGAHLAPHALPGPRTLEYCSLDPELFPAGKHPVRESRVIAFHSNHRPDGRRGKVRALKSLGLWVWDGSQCSWRD